MNQNDLKSRRNTLIIVLIISCLEFLSPLLFFISMFALGLSSVGVNNDLTAISLTMSIIMILGGIFFFISNLVCGIIILTKNWKNKEIKDISTLWGVLTLIPLGCIASFAFSIISLKILNKKYKEEIIEVEIINEDKVE